MTAREALLAVVAELAPTWDQADYGGLLTDAATRGVRPEDVLMQTAIAIKRGEGVREVRAALASKPWNRPRKDQQ